MKKILSKIAAISAIASFSFGANLFAHSSHQQADDHAPIGVMRDHVHNKGEFMASYRFKYMKMHDLRAGDNKSNKHEVFKSYNMSPVEMSMKMHMLGAMYGVTDNLTLTGMLSAAEKNMTSEMKMNGRNMKARTAQIGDSKINALYQFLNKDKKRAQFNLGLSLPTGAYNEKNNVTQLPYAMQIGSGSYELLPGVSYVNKKYDFSFGAQINATFRLDANDRGYKLGDAYNATAWIAKNINSALSLSTRLDYNKKEAIEGVDKSLNTVLTPASNISVYDSQRLDLLLGSNFIVPKGALKGNRIGLEFGMPIYERIDGPLLETDYVINLGWQKTF